MQNLCFNYADTRSRSQLRAAGDKAVLQTAFLLLLKLTVCVQYISTEAIRYICLELVQNILAAILSCS